MPERTSCTMIFVPLLHYFLCKNDYSGNEAGLRYRLTPGKRTVPDPDGGADATKEEKILTVDYWPAPWTIDKTDPALSSATIIGVVLAVLMILISDASTSISPVGIFGFLLELL